MGKRVLVIGGAGFIGSHLVDELLKRGHEVTVYDNLEPQVHNGKKPSYLNGKAEYIYADIRNTESLKAAVHDTEIIFHEAAAVGVGQSMYHIQKYVDVNTHGTAKLLDILVNEEHGVEKLIVASSMSIYGEGKYECEECGVVFPHTRLDEQLRQHQWEMHCPKCGKVVRPLPTDEEKPLHPTSIYAITKKDQEEMCLTIGRAYGLPTVALRYFNVYGPRQALSNPYTGVCAIFSCRIRNHNPPLIFEDGLQSRDFVSVYDIVGANLIALEKNKANYEAFNVGSGTGTTIKEISEVLTSLYGIEIDPLVTNTYREGDIRHCFADISKISKLGYAPRVKFEDGMRELVEWVNTQPSCNVEDRFEKAHRELEMRKLAK